MGNRVLYTSAHETLCSDAKNWDLILLFPLSRHNISVKRYATWGVRQ